jgi:transcriptional regulator with XRE-family HTH domain
VQTERFGDRLRKLRLEKFGKSLSLRDAAARLGITHPYLVQLEAGSEKPSEELARRIARLFREDEEEMVFIARGVPKAITDIVEKFPARTLAAIAPFARDIFISHRSTDKAWARSLAQHLRGIDIGGRNCQVWLDEGEISPGQSITGEINRGLETSKFIALALTPDYFKSESGWTDAEWQAALFQDPAGRQSRVIPLLVKDCPYIPVLLRHLNMIDFRDSRDFERSLTTLVSILKNGAPVSPIAARGQIIAPSERISRTTLVAERAVSVAKPDVVEETLSCNLLPIINIPEFVWLAPIARHLRGPKGKSTVAKETLKDEIRRVQTERGEEKPFMPAFLRHGDSLLSFHNLEAEEGPLAPVADPRRAQRLAVANMPEDPDLYKLLMTLLNMTVQRHCFHVGLVTGDGDLRKRFFFPALEPRVDRTYSWRASARPRTVAKFYFDKAGDVKFCRHIAAKLPVIYLGRRYYLHISPTWIFTKDGGPQTLLRGPKLGVLAMRWTGRERNLQILYHSRFWSYVLSDRRSLIRMHAGDQTMLVDTRPAFIRLPVGIANDRANLDSLIYNLADDFDWRAFELPGPVEEMVDAASEATADDNELDTATEN